ncbi:MAG: MFS transporter [Anaerolineales bacterium]|nr:MFS transporter [Anaerolineales bacterium]
MSVAIRSHESISEQEYKRRIRAWTMYDWANSAFATTILAAVLPVYYSQVAGATLSSPAEATAKWSFGLSISLFIIALLSPILGTISDVIRGKKRFLSIFVGMGTVATGLLVLVKTGDWLLASILFIIARIGFTGANVFYDALLPHVAREEDQDVVSTRGYALGYLGGGILLAINIAMIQILPGLWGSRLSFLSVGIWWAVFSIPIFTRIPEPPAATAKLGPGENVLSISFKRLRNTFRDISRYKELFKYLLSFLIYNDGIGTIIGVAAIYGAELGFGSIELILALLLVQFVGIPYSLIFGRLPDVKTKRRPFFLAFILFNVIALPALGLIGASALPGELTGGPLPAYQPTETAAGEGIFTVDHDMLTFTGTWDTVTLSADELKTDYDVSYAQTADPEASLLFHFNGQKFRIGFSTGPDYGIWEVLLDGEPYIDEGTGEILLIDSYNPTLRYGAARILTAPNPGEHEVVLRPAESNNPESTGSLLSISELEVLAPVRSSNLGIIIGLIFAVELVGLLLSWLLGPMLFTRFAQLFNTKRSILLSLCVYSVIAVWGFILDSVIEFWCLAWMVSIVQGGSQALSRSMYASMSPAAKSGEFFGLFGIMEKFSSILGPLVFAGAVAIFGSSRPAVLGVVAFFIVGGLLLTRVDVEAGKEAARREDALFLAEQ